MTLLDSDFYKHLLANSTDLLTIIDEGGIYKYVGDSVEPLMGYKVDDLVGQNAFDLIHPEDLPAVLEAFEQIAHCEKMLIKPFRYKSKNNEWRWLECTCSNQTKNQAIKGYVTNSRDITETIDEKTQKDLHQAYYKSLFEEHPDAVFSLDTNGNFKSVNKQFCRILGLPEDVIISTQFTEFIHPLDARQLFSLFESTVAGASQTTELKVFDTSKNIKIVHLTLLPVYFNGQVVAVQGIAEDITNDVNSQNVISENLEQFRKIFESVTEPFFALDADWNYTFTNKAYCDWMQQSQENFTGANIWELYPSTKKSAFYKKCIQVAQTGKTEYLEEVYPSENNITLRYSIFPFDGGIAIHFVDITSQSALKRELEKLSLVASKTSNGVIIMDPQGRIDWVNDGFTRLTGYSKEEALGAIPSKLLQGPETDPETSVRVREKYADQVYFKEELINYRKDGQKYWVGIDVTPIKDATGELINYIAIQSDITEKKNAEAKLIKLADDLFKQNINLQQFTYMVSHNLRAPVANALGLTRLIHKVEVGSPQFNSILEKLDTSIIQLDGVIKDINSILTIKDADRTLPRENVNLLSITQEVLSPFQDELVAINSTLELDINSSYKMLSNKAYLYSIIQNLISNAIKYRSPNRALKLTLRVEKDVRGYIYTVSDNGLGLEMDVVKKQMFKLYKRFHPETHGKGIGLFLVKTQVETIGGKILVESKPDVGTTFKLLLGAKHV